MKSETAIVAAHIRHQQWMDDIRDCNSRPLGMTVAEWCNNHQISRDTYYYRMKTLRKLCLYACGDNDETDIRENLAVNPKFVELVPKPEISTIAEIPATAVIRVGNAEIEVHDNITDDFLRRIVEVASHA